jgi:hypothetical protein
VFTARKRVAAIAGAVLLGAVLALNGATPAQAFIGGTLPPGSVVCTDRTRSNQGVAFYGALQAPVIGPTALWTVYASTTAAGPEIALLRLSTQEPTTTYVSWPGVFYYRLCITNTSSATGGLRFAFFPQGANSAGGFGPYSAVLGSGGRYCAPSTSVAARLTGTSNVPIHWTADVENFNADFLRTEDYGTSTTIDRSLTPGDDEIFKVCASNTSGATATLSFDLT